MTKIFKQRKAELEKGCGEVIDWDNKFSDPAYVCRNGFLCPKCEAELKGLQEGYDLALKELHKKESEAHHKGYRFAKAEDLKIVEDWIKNKGLTFPLQKYTEEELKDEISKEGK